MRRHVIAWINRCPPFFFHGYSSSKEISAFFGYMLAMKGIRAILPEADMHGERFDGNDAMRLRGFWQLLKKSIDELELYRAFYVERGLMAQWRRP